MQNAPKVGDRVQLVEGHRYYPSVGTVTKVWPKRTFLVADDDPRWDDPDFIPPRGGPTPESRWQVSMKLDALPPDWAYGAEQFTFCPDVSEVEPA